MRVALVSTIKYKNRTLYQGIVKKVKVTSLLIFQKPNMCMAHKLRRYLTRIENVIRERVYLIVSFGITFTVFKGNIGAFCSVKFNFIDTSYLKPINIIITF